MSEPDDSVSYADLREMYLAQCACTDEWAEKYRKAIYKRADATLTARVNELELALASVNKALSERGEELLMAKAFIAAAIRAAVEAEREAEREACAKVCESIAFQYRNGGHGHAAERAANAIRARGAA